MCGKPNEINKNTHPKNINTLSPRAGGVYLAESVDGPFTKVDQLR